MPTLFSRVTLINLLFTAVCYATPIAPTWGGPKWGSSNASHPWEYPRPGPDSAHCHCFPGDACWPDDNIWSSFNSTIGGTLIATVPIASPCHYDPFTTYNAGVCQNLQTAWTSPATHYDSPSSIAAPYFTNNSCNPFLPPSAPCVIGSYVSYSVNATDASIIKKTILFATYFNIRLVIRNTGLDYNGKSSGAGAIAIWTHALRQIDFLDYNSSNYTGKAVKVAAGVQGMDLFEAVSAQGLAVVGPEVPSVGYTGGYIQGGGHSALSSKYGLAVDQVLEWEVVDGRGRLLRASPTQNADLYWALAGGGGGTYGVVVSVTSKAYPDIPVIGANISFTNTGVTQDQFFEAIETYHESLPAIVDAGAVSVEFFTNSFFAVSPLTAPGLTSAQVEALLTPLTDKLKQLGIQYAQTITQFPGYLSEFQTMLAPVPVAVGQYGGRFIPRSVVEQNNTALTAAYRSIVEQGAEVACIGLNVNHSSDGSRPWNSANPYWRRTLIETAIQTTYNYTAPLSDAVAQQDLMTDVFIPSLTALTPDGGAYMNEGDFRQPGFQDVFYGSNYAELVQIKNKYDPYHVFYAVTAVGSDYWVEAADGRLCKAS